MPAAGAKGASKIQGEIKDDTSAAREEKKVPLCPVTDCESMYVLCDLIKWDGLIKEKCELGWVLMMLLNFYSFNSRES